MTAAPERIWACMGGPMVGMFVSGGNNGGWPEYVRADIVQALTAERNKAVLGNHRFNEHEPTWAELADFWKARAEKAEADNAQLREALQFYADASWSSLDDDLGNNGRPGVKARAALRGHDDD